MAEKENKKELAECQKQKQEYLTGWQRARADLINYKKEQEKDIEGLLERAKEKMILKILPVLDNFAIAERNLEKEIKKNKSVKGLRQIKNQLEEFLKSQGVEEIKVLGQEFDPAVCEVIEEVKKENAPARTVLAVAQKGYQLNNRLIRPAKVKISK